MRGVALCAAVVAGTAAGALGHAALTGSAPRDPAPVVARGPVPPPVVACTASLAPADLAALRVELAALIDERLGEKPHAPPAAPPHADEPSTGAADAVASANQILDAALTQGTWRDADRSAFRTAIAAMSTPQRSEAMSRLLTALNEGRLRREVAGPIL